MLRHEDLVNIGRFAGPVLFTLACQVRGRYAGAFALMVLPALPGLGCVLRARRVPRSAVTA